jgi:cysteinyl-tRNA synthetase
MSDIYLTNSLTRKKEMFVPINSLGIGMYTCGPTVYDYAHIGNFRTYTTADVLLRTFEYNGYKVKYVMNLTDVGHLTGDNLGDADSGVDRMEKASKREGKSAWDIAKYYTDDFIDNMNQLNLRTPNVLPKATEHIKEQIDLIRALEEKKFTYKINDGVYFNIKEYETKTGNKYGQLSTLDKIKEGARVEKNPQKKDPRDFALWKFSHPKGRSLDSVKDDLSHRRQMEWESPWGVGFPGWHIECSAMSMRYLGESFDIHVGGEDLRSTHHPNEIAQSEGATGKQFVKYWLHVTFLQVDGKRMSKSTGNVYTVKDLIKRNIDPLALRYLYLTANYRDTLNFTWNALSSSQTALFKLRELISSFRESKGRIILSEDKKDKVDKFSGDFQSAINDDLNTSRALAVLWEAIKSNIPGEDKYDLALLFDEVLGLKLGYIPESVVEMPSEIKTLLLKREKYRREGKFGEADLLRKQLNKKGYKVEDSKEGSRIRKKNAA